MKRAIATAITLLCVACGDSTPVATESVSEPRAERRGASDENGPPEIAKAEIRPAEPSADDALALEVEARDPDRDPLEVSVEWYRNGELEPDAGDYNMPAGSFARDDRIYAMVYVKAGEHEVSRQTAAVVIGNARPTLRSFAIQPERATGLDLLEVEPTVSDSDGDSVAIAYQWFRNGQPIAGAITRRLEPGMGHRGEQIIVQANADDGRDKSGWVASAPMVLGNAAPAITTQPNYSPSASGEYSYAVEAKDPDGDRPLRYELVAGPPGMSVDVASGVVHWKVPADAHGVYPIELAVSDPFGGKTTQSYSLAVDWTEEPASPNKSAPTPARSPANAPAGAAATSAGVGVEASDEDEANDTDEDQAEEPEDDEL